MLKIEQSKTHEEIKMAAPKIKVRADEEKECGLYIASFANGSLIPEKAQDFRFACYQYQGSKKTLKSKRTLVCETNHMQYVGQSTKQNDLNSRYLVAVYNKRRGKVFLYDGEMFELHPKHEDSEEEATKDESAMSYRERMDELTSSFGTVRNRRAMETRIKNKIQDDALDAAMSNVVADVMMKPDAYSTTAKPSVETADDIIPPYNANASTPAEVYKLDTIIPNHIKEALKLPAREFIDTNLDTLRKWTEEKKYASYILNHLAMLPVEGTSRHHKSCCLMYLHYMMKLYQMKVTSLRKARVFDENVPKVVENFLLKSFTVEALMAGRKKSRCMPARLKDKLLAHMCVLCLILDEYSFDYKSLMNDLKIGQKKLVQILKSTGCTIKEQKAVGRADTATAVLKIPLTFPKVTARAKRERR